MVLGWNFILILSIWTHQPKELGGKRKGSAEVN